MTRNRQTVKSRLRISDTVARHAEEAKLDFIKTSISGPKLIESRAKYFDFIEIHHRGGKGLNEMCAEAGVTYHVFVQGVKQAVTYVERYLVIKNKNSAEGVLPIGVSTIAEDHNGKKEKISR